MRIRVIESGGFAGLRRERVVETGVLPADRRVALEQRVAGAAFFALPERLLSGLPDVIQYRLEILDAGRSHCVVFDDPCATEPLRALIECLFEEGEA